MGSFKISTVAGRVLAELPLDDALDFVVSDLLERLPPLDGAGVPRLLLRARELGWSERLADLAPVLDEVVTLVLLPDPEKAAADLMGTEGTAVRLAAARALQAMGAVAARQAKELADAALSDPDAEVVGEALQALRAIGAAVESAAEWQDIKRLEGIAQFAQDLEDARELDEQFCPLFYDLTRQLEALLASCHQSPGQAALRSQTLLRRLAPVDLEAARRYEPLLADPLDDPRVAVRLARVVALEEQLMNDWAPDDGGVGSKLCGALVGDACLEVRRRAAAIVGCASRDGYLVNGLDLARAALAAEVEALQRSALPDDLGRMEAVQEFQRLLG